jgi:hypothetical protein
MMKRKRNATGRYEQQRDHHLERVLCYLSDCYDADPTVQSMQLSDLRAFLHLSGAAAFLLPIVAHLQKRGLVTLDTSTDGRQTIYFTQKFIDIARGGLSAVHPATPAD